MKTECKLPAGLNPKSYCSEDDMNRKVSCPSCPRTFKISEGVSYEGLWTCCDENDNEMTEYGMLIFCSLACTLDALDIEGHA